MNANKQLNKQNADTGITEGMLAEKGGEKKLSLNTSNHGTFIKIIGSAEQRKVYIGEIAELDKYQ